MNTYIVPEYLDFMAEKGYTAENIDLWKFAEIAGAETWTSVDNYTLSDGTVLKTGEFTNDVYEFMEFVKKVVPEEFKGLTQNHYSYLIERIDDERSLFVEFGFSMDDNGIFRGTIEKIQIFYSPSFETAMKEYKKRYEGN